jgi:hypothetical protein
MTILSDEEFLAQAPAIEKQLEATIQASETPAATPAPAAAVETPPAAETPPETPPAAATPPEGTPPGETPPEGSETPPEGGGTPKEPPDYKAIYDQLFGKPIRAGGQDITLNTPDEAISLIQKGVGFHAKMNRVHNDLKYVEMLRNKVAVAAAPGSVQAVEAGTASPPTAPAPVAAAAAPGAAAWAASREGLARKQAKTAKQATRKSGLRCVVFKAGDVSQERKLQLSYWSVSLLGND